MKKNLFLLALTMACCASGLFAQSKVTNRDLIVKKWKLQIDIKEEIEDELDDSDDFFERIVIKSVSGLVDNILDEIDIYFEFMKGNELRVVVNAFEETETEYTSWRINKDGALIIDDTDNFEYDDDSIWLMVDDVLVAYDEEGDGDLEQQSVYLVQID